MTVPELQVVSDEFCQCGHRESAHVDDARHPFPSSIGGGRYVRSVSFNEALRGRKKRGIQPELRPAS